MRKQTTFWLFTIIILVAAVGLWLARAVFTTQDVPAQAQPHGLAATPQNLRYLGFEFNAISMADRQAQGAVTEKQAIATSIKNDPGLKAATGVSAMLGFLRDINPHYIDHDMADMGLVWLVTFDGIKNVSSGPPGAPRGVSNAESVVIDAKSGDYIMAFTLSDFTAVTPENNPIPTFDGTAEATPLPPSNAIPTIAPTFAP
ncbi:MAG: hypothetical protein WA821_01445 [Anaerolineales bacterium]